MIFVSTQLCLHSLLPFPNMNTNPTITPLKRSPRVYDDMEFLAEHFDYLLVDLLDDWYNGYNLVVYKAIDAYEDYIKNNRPEIKPMEMHNVSSFLSVHQLVV